MARLFETRVSYYKTIENGSQKKTIETYLVDAMSFAEAEARTIEELTPYMSSEFTVKTAKRCNISEIVNLSADRYYLSRVGFITIDEKTAKEKRTVSSILIGASSFDDAYQRLKELMNSTVADIQLVSLAETSISDVITAKS